MGGRECRGDVCVLGRRGAGAGALWGGSWGAEGGRGMLLMGRRGYLWEGFGTY